MAAGKIGPGEAYETERTVVTKCNSKTYNEHD